MFKCKLQNLLRSILFTKKVKGIVQISFDYILKV